MVDVCRIAVVGVEPIFREGVVQALCRDRRLVVAAQGATGQEAEHLAREDRPDVLLLEAAVPGSLTTAQTILTAHRNVKVIFLASVEDQEHARQALHIGVHGYIIKTITAPELVQAIATVHRGGRYISHDLSWRLVTNRPTTPTRSQIADKSHLSPREQQVLEYTLRGFTNLQIACKLGLSLSTAKYHKTIAFRKLGVRNRLGVIATMSKVAKHGGPADVATLLSLPSCGQAAGVTSPRCAPAMDRPLPATPSKSRQLSASAPPPAAFSTNPSTTGVRRSVSPPSPSKLLAAGRSRSALPGSGGGTI